MKKKFDKLMKYKLQVKEYDFPSKKASIFEKTRTKLMSNSSI